MHIMRTTLNLSNELIDKLILTTGIHNKTKIIHLALEEYLRKLKRKKVADMYGKIKINEDVLKLRDK